MRVYRVYFKNELGWVQTLATTNWDCAMDCLEDLEKDGFEVKVVSEEGF